MPINVETMPRSTLSSARFCTANLPILAIRASADTTLGSLPSNAFIAFIVALARNAYWMSPYWSWTRLVTRVDAITYGALRQAPTGFCEADCRAEREELIDACV